MSDPTSDQKARRRPPEGDSSSWEGLAPLAMSARTIIPYLDGGSPSRGVLPNGSRLIDAWSGLKVLLVLEVLVRAPQCPWTIRHDYVAPRLPFVFPLPCSLSVLGLGGLLLFNLATLRKISLLTKRGYESRCIRV